MKKILLATVIVALSIAVIVMGLKLRRLSPAEDYEYSFSQDVDADYYDQAALRDYFSTGYAVGSFAREMWKAEGIDVRFPDSDDASHRAATLHYNSLKAFTDSLGLRLARSKQLKTQGLSNAEIRLMETTGISLEDAKLVHAYGAIQLSKGDRSNFVLVLQNQLTQLGYVIPNDGFFWSETELAIRDFQVKQKLFASGIADATTLRTLQKLSPIRTH